MDQNQATLVVPDKHGNHVPTPCLKTSEARRTLEVRFTPNRNNEAKATHLTEVAKEWGESLGVD